MKIQQKLALMSGTLSEKLEAYLKEYDRLKPDYQNIMAELYDTIDKQSKLKSTMMPNIEIAETNAKEELAKLTAANINPVAVQDVSLASVYTVNNAVLGMAKCIVNSTIYKIELIDDTTSFVSQTWKGKFRLTNYSDENDTAENKGYITLTINDDYACQIEQKIRKRIDRDDIYLVDIFDVKTDINVFKAELKKYCLNRLNSFESAYQSVIDIMIDANCANNSVYGDIYDDLYLPYYNKLTAIQDETKVRIAEIEAVDKKLSELEKSQAEITGYLNLESFLGIELWKELCSSRREDSFENSNYISDGLDNGELLQKAQELLEKAQIDAVTASTLQMSLSATMFNLLAIPEFQKLTGMFEGGNWIRVKLDEKIYRLRLVHYKIDFSQIQNIEVEFSDVTETYNGLNDTKSLMDKVSSMATNFSYVAHQAEQGSKSFTELDTIKNDGLNAALYNISSSINQEFIIDEHGITGRQWDDIMGDYLPEQVKFSNNCLVYTDDYWQTGKAALGKIEFYNPVLKKTVSRYGLIADAVISGVLMGNDIFGGNIYSENYSSGATSPAGTHIDLNNGDFSFAGGKLRFDSESNELNVTGKITSTSGTIGGFTIGSSSICNGTNSLTSTTVGIYLGTNGIRQYASSNAYTNITNGILTAKGANITGTISTDNITATGGNIGGWNIGERRLYADYDIYRAYIQAPASDTDWVFSAQSKSNSGDGYNGEFIVQANGKLTAKNADISGTITATSGTIGNWIIGVPDGLGLKECIYTKTDLGIVGLQSSSSEDHIAFFVKGKKGNDITYIKNNGEFYSQKAIIEGKSKIGEWEIKENQLSATSDDDKYTTFIQKATDEDTWVFSAQVRGDDGGLYGKFRVYANGDVVTQKITANDTIIANNTIIANKIKVNDMVTAKGAMEILTSNNASNLILHNDYGRTVYLRYDEQSRFYIIPHTSDGSFDTQNCFYMDAYTGDCCARSFVSASSIRYKENIKTLSDDFIGNFSKIRPVSFDYKPNIGYKNQYGLIAEEMEEIYPYVVTHDRDGNCEAIDYSKLTVLLIKKIQAMDKEIQHLYETIKQYTV